MTQTFAHGYALLIGVGQCLDSRFSLPVPVKDMEALRQILVNPDLCAYPDNDQHVRLLHDQDATRPAILAGLTWLKERAAADPEATVIIYYSGHGWLETMTQQYFLIPHEFDGYDWRDTAFNAEEFNQAVHQIPAQRRLVILDCCHAAGMATAKEGEPEPKLPRGVIPTAEPKGLIDALKQGEGRVVFTSCRGEQKSWIRADRTLSLYTHHLIEALQGAASLPGATEVTVFDIANHLGKAVPESARAMGKAQTPRFEMAETERFAIALLQGGKGLPPGGWEVLQPQVNVPQVSVQASGERSVAIGGNVNGGTIITGDRNVVGSGNVVQQGNTNLNIHKASHFLIGDTIYSNLVGDEAARGNQKEVGNLKAIRKSVEALTVQEFLDLCQDDFPAVSCQFTEGQTKAQQIRLLVDYASRHREIPKLLAAIKEINPIAYEFAAQQGDLAPVADEPPRGASSENAEASSSPMTETCDVLVLAANPQGTAQLQLEQEAALIQQRLQEGDSGREYVVRVEQAVRVEELSRYLLQYKPVIVHFAGHGSPGGEIILENHQNQAQPVSAEAIAGLFAAIPGQTECVVLNACFSLELADALAEWVRCVIGIDKEIDDKAAVRFTGGFYRGLGFGQGYYKAFELGRNEIQLLKLPNADAPRFVTRDMTLLDAQVDGQVQQLRVTRSFVLAETTRQTATLYPLWYGTNRRLIDPSDVTQGFSGERDTQMHYGSCQVAVPKSHRIGSAGSAWWQRLLPWKDDRLKLDRQSLAEMVEDQFWTGVRRALQEHDTGERMALVFIHGFNVSFEDAALRSAQIGFDLQVPGMTAFYSWPSKGKLTGYTADEASIQASEPYIAQFLSQFATQSGAERVHIIAHSMGNRGLLRSIQRIVHQAQVQSHVPFGQIFLAAPDEDPDVFRDLATAYQTVAQRTTLYVSAKDKALATSGIIHDYPRAGFSPPVTIVPGVDTVEVSNIDLTLLGHGYYGDARDLLQDMHNLLRHNTPPEQRFGLREVLAGGDRRYWMIGR